MHNVTHTFDVKQGNVDNINVQNAVLDFQFPKMRERFSSFVALENHLYLSWFDTSHFVGCSKYGLVGNFFCKNIFFAPILTSAWLLTLKIRTPQTLKNKSDKWD